MITGAPSWGLARLGAHHTGKVMSWIGTALYAAYAVGAPAGTVLYARNGFGAVALATALLPLAALALVARLRSAPLQKQAPSSLLDVVGTSYAVALLGVTLTGAGYSLVYPGLGVEAIRRAPAASRGLAMGAYTAFLDLSLGLSSPALGLVAGGAGLPAVFGASALAVLCSAAIVVGLLRRPNPVQAPGP